MLANTIHRIYHGMCARTAMRGAFTPKRFFTDLNQAFNDNASRIMGATAVMRPAPARCLPAEPNMIFMFCTACPAAPLTRLSITDNTTAMSPPLRLVHGDAAQIRAAHRTRIGMAARGHHIDERLHRHSTSRTVPADRRLSVKPRIKRGVDAADHRRQMRRECELHRLARHLRQSLRNFRLMPVARHAVGLEVVGGFGKQRMHFGLAARAGDAGFGIGDQMLDIDQPASTSGRKPSCTAVG